MGDPKGGPGRSTSLTDLRHERRKRTATADLRAAANKPRPKAAIAATAAVRARQRRPSEHFYTDCGDLLRVGSLPQSQGWERCPHRPTRTNFANDYVLAAGRMDDPKYRDQLLKLARDWTAALQPLDGLRDRGRAPACNQGRLLCQPLTLWKPVHSTR
jgi:hypothetical protein